MLAFIGTQEWLIILGVGVLLFGAKKLPELGRSLGEGLKEFKKSTKAVIEDDEEEKKPASEQKPATE